MKHLLFPLLLLVAMAGYGQIKINPDHHRLDSLLKAAGAIEENRGITGSVQTAPIVFNEAQWHDSPRYDTIKVIAEVYILPHKITFGMSCLGNRCHDDSVWAQLDVRRGPWGPVDTTFVGTEKVLAWEVWEMADEAWTEQDKPRRIPIDRVKTLTYNKKDTLSHVLQSWRVEW